MKKYIKTGYHYLRSLLSRYRLSRIENGCLIILTYHRILPEQHPACLLEQPGMVLSPDALDMQLALLTQVATPILLEDWLSKKQNAQLDSALYFAVTFDDGWKDNYDYALPVLKKHNIPATIFLVSKMVGSDKDFWPGRLSTLIKAIATFSSTLTSSGMDKILDTGEISRIKNISNDFIDTTINQAKQYSDAEINQMIDEFYLKNPAIIENKSVRVLLNEEEIKEMESTTLINFGSHTQNHQRMSDRLSDETLRDEIKASKNDIDDLCQRVSPIFCYPNGDTSAKAAHMVSTTYIGACTTQKGINQPDCNAFELKRFNLHNGNSGYREIFFSSLLDQN